jgi:hypothetical protein
LCLRCARRCRRSTRADADAMDALPLARAALRGRADSEHSPPRKERERAVFISSGLERQRRGYRVCRSDAASCPRRAPMRTLRRGDQITREAELPAMKLGARGMLSSQVRSGGFDRIRTASRLCGREGIPPTIMSMRSGSSSVTPAPGRAAAQPGETVEAENCRQLAEHYLRLMKDQRE